MTNPVPFAIGATLFLVVAGGLLTPIDAWYRNLRKPRWNPPNWLFGPAWGLILCLWGYAIVLAWRGTSDAAGRQDVLILFGVTALFHLLWSPLFFKFRRPDLAVIEVLFLWASLLALLIGVRPYSVTATWLIVPYFAWVSFAACLNGVIVGLNRRSR